MSLKLKTRSSAAKRYRKTCQNKYIRRKAYRGHILEKKSPKCKRNLRNKAVVTKGDAAAIKLMLPNY